MYLDSHLETVTASVHKGKYMLTRRDTPVIKTIVCGELMVSVDEACTVDRLRLEVWRSPQCK